MFGDVSWLLAAYGITTDRLIPMLGLISRVWLLKLLDSPRSKSFHTTNFDGAD